MLHANIREVDISIDDVGDDIAGLAQPKFVGRENGCLKIDARRLAQP